MSKVFAGMAASLDGYIASTDGDLAWLNDSMLKGEDYGFAETMQRTGAYIIGANTYKGMMGMNMGGGKNSPPTYVVTHQADLKVPKGIHLYAGDLKELIEKVKTVTDKDICIFGGGDLVTQLIAHELLDELSISIIPVILGGGVPFFGKVSKMKRLKLTECKHFGSGIVILNYSL